MKRLFLTTLAALTLALPALAKDDDNIAERWECKLSDATDWDDIIIVASIENGHKSGYLWAAGVTNDSLFQVKGLDRNWSFTANEAGGYDYTFVITASSKGKFYDFSKGSEKTLTTVSKVLDCRREDD
ncbi:MAG: hypothetical protein HRU20_14450 [Pseudomonadales bacterium]|nr:hypothetical protein [Pseudomonadales bacterium]